MKALKFSSLAVVALAVGSVLAGCSSDVRDEPTVGDGFNGMEEELLAGELASPVSDEDIADPSLADDGTDVPDTADTQAADADDLSVQAAQTANGAIGWYKARTGSKAYEGYCEKAARLAWNRKTRHPSAIDHWRSGDGAKHSGKAPKGAFVFWNTSQYGHVAVADGAGGAWSTSVGHKIGHVKSVSYFRNYLGWKYGNSN
ncbi:hypothetical protein LZC95_06535 [Pendulispora brunnea]|uniref:CHAP domain-containing protein n=1 Tax=Pendulispora brunnea TaxID=2905690 RepID=A0ABZ2KCU8_9BACT